MIYRLTHLTRYDYQAAVDLSIHLAHLTPRALPCQQVGAATLATDPPLSWRRDVTDHFGNRQSWLFVDVPHATLTVTATAEVTRTAPDPPGGAHAWDALPVPPAVAEFALSSPLAPAHPEAGAWAAASFPPGRPVAAAALALTRRIFASFRFRPGVSTVATPVGETLARREGVCQDFTHLMLAMLRQLGVPARYVSGYIRTRPPPGGTRRLGADQSHAWVSVWDGAGWFDLDPTNGIAVADEHVTLAWGRDYADIAPLRGLILGGGGQALSVSVALEEIGGDQAATLATAAPVNRSSAAAEVRNTCRGDPAAAQIGSSASRS